MKRTVTISEMAEYCQVTAETIRRWIDSGAIPAKRTLGGHRRIEYDDFLAFLKKNDIPVDRKSLGTKQRILIVSADGEFTGTILRKKRLQNPMNEFEVAGNAFEAGFKVSEFQPDYVIFDGGLSEHDLDSAIDLIRKSASTREIVVILFAEENGSAHTLRSRSAVDYVFRTPDDLTKIKGLISA